MGRGAVEWEEIVDLDAAMVRRIASGSGLGRVEG